MQFLHSASLSGPTHLHITPPDKHVTSSSKALRKSQSHASILSPIIRLVRYPVTTLECAFETLWTPEEQNALEKRKLDQEQRRQILIQRLKDATDLQTWQNAAEDLDAIEGNNAWKADSVSPLYDYELLESRLKELEGCRMSKNPARIIWVLRNTLTRSLSNMGDIQLYKHSHIGTKKLIESYINSVCDTFDTLLHGYDKWNPKLNARDVYEELLRMRQSFGRSALLLSGGGTFGMTHCGVVKVLFENNLLPRIISGSSAGSIVASVLCTRTDEELPAALTAFCTGDMEVFEREDENSFMQKMVRILTTRCVFDVQNLVRVMRGWLGDITFLEAYNRTLRILNVSVSSTSMNELPRLMNYVTAPNVIVWSAVVASCSVPLVFLPTTILAKDPRTGEQGPWNPSQQYMDGSVDSDLPMNRLAEMFNVNHFIVSQVNPHVLPFIERDENSFDRALSQHTEQTTAEASSIWASVGDIAKSEILHRMHQLADFGVFPTTITKVRSLMTQKYSGDITILPEIELAMYPRVLKNPNRDFMDRALHSGERATWPKLSRISNHLAIELAIDRSIQKMRTKMAFSPSQVDLRKMSLTTSKQSETARTRQARLYNVNRDKHQGWNANPSLTHVSQLTAQFQLHPDAAFEEKLRASMIELPPSSSMNQENSGSDSDDEDTDQEGFFLNLNSRRRKRPFQASSPDLAPYDSNTSNIRSRSPSPSGSPDPVTSTQMPKMWPISNRRSHKSQPSTPVPWKHSRRRSFADIRTGSMKMTTSQPEESSTGSETPKPMSEVEKRYKRLFHSGLKAFTPYEKK